MEKDSKGGGSASKRGARDEPAAASAIDPSVFAAQSLLGGVSGAGFNPLLMSGFPLMAAAAAAGANTTAVPSSTAAAAAMGGINQANAAWLGLMHHLATQEYLNRLHAGGAHAAAAAAAAAAATSSSSPAHQLSGVNYEALAGMKAVAALANASGGSNQKDAPGGSYHLPDGTELVKQTSSISGPKVPGTTNRGRKKTISLDPTPFGSSSSQDMLSHGVSSILSRKSAEKRLSDSVTITPTMAPRSSSDRYRELELMANKVAAHSGGSPQVTITPVAGRGTTMLTSSVSLTPVERAAAGSGAPQTAPNVGEAPLNLSKKSSKASRHSLPSSLPSAMASSHSPATSDSAGYPAAAAAAAAAAALGLSPLTPHQQLEQFRNAMASAVMAQKAMADYQQQQQLQQQQQQHQSSSRTRSRKHVSSSRSKKNTVASLLANTRSFDDTKSSGAAGGSGSSSELTVEVRPRPASSTSSTASSSSALPPAPLVLPSSSSWTGLDDDDAGSVKSCGSDRQRPAARHARSDTPSLSDDPANSFPYSSYLARLKREHEDSSGLDSEDVSESEAETSGGAGSSLSTSSGPGPHSKRRRIVTDEEKLRRPLLNGWRRETTIRKLTQAGPRGDVVYYAPCGKAFRQFPDILRYLERNGIPDVSRDNFTFSSKVIIGSYLKISDDGEECIPISESEVRKQVDILSGGKKKMFKKPYVINIKSDERASAAAANAAAAAAVLGPGVTLSPVTAAAPVANPSDHQSPSLTSASATAAASAASAAANASFQQAIDMMRRLEEERKMRLLREEQKRKEKELRNAQLMEERRKKQEELERHRVAESIRKAQELSKQREMLYILELERERRRHHMVLVKSLEARRRHEERDRRREDLRLERAAGRDRRSSKKLLPGTAAAAGGGGGVAGVAGGELETVARVQKRPVEDMQLKDHKQLPAMPRLSGLYLSGDAFANCVVVYEFLHNFGATLGFDAGQLPTLASLQLGALNATSHEEQLLAVLAQLVVCAVEDPGVPHPMRHVTLLGQSLRQADITHAALSEVLRIYLTAMATNEVKQLTGLTLNVRDPQRHKNEDYYAAMDTNRTSQMAGWLRRRPFLALTPSQKTEIMAHICNDLLQNKAVLKQIDSSVEAVNVKRKEKAAMEVLLRRFQQLYARKRPQPARVSTEPTARPVGSDQLPPAAGQPETAAPPPPPPPAAAAAVPSASPAAAAVGAGAAAASGVGVGGITNGNGTDCGNSGAEQQPAVKKEEHDDLKEDGFEDEREDSGNEEEAADDVSTHDETVASVALSSECDLQRYIEQLADSDLKLGRQLFRLHQSVRACNVGQDRYRRTYWLLPAAGGVYVEALESGGVPPGEQAPEIAPAPAAVAAADSPDTTGQTAAAATAVETATEQLQLQDASALANGAAVSCDQRTSDSTPADEVRGAAGGATAVSVTDSSGCVKQEPMDTDDAGGGGGGVDARHHVPADCHKLDQSASIKAESSQTEAGSAGVAEVMSSVDSDLQWALANEKQLAGYLACTVPSLGAAVTSGQLKAGGAPQPVAGLGLVPSSCLIQALHTLERPWFSLVARDTCEPPPPPPPATSSGSGAGALLAPDGSDEEDESAGHTTAQELDENVHAQPQPIPEQFARGWWRVTQRDQVEALCSSLHARGIRERALKSRLLSMTPLVGHSCSQAGEMSLPELTESDCDSAVTAYQLQSSATLTTSAVATDVIAEADPHSPITNGQQHQQQQQLPSPPPAAAAAAAVVNGVDGNAGGDAVDGESGVSSGHTALPGSDDAVLTATGDSSGTSLPVLTNGGGSSGGDSGSSAADCGGVTESRSAQCASVSAQSHDSTQPGLLQSDGALYGEQPVQGEGAPAGGEADEEEEDGDEDCDSGAGAPLSPPPVVTRPVLPAFRCGAAVADSDSRWRLDVALLAELQVLEQLENLEERIAQASMQLKTWRLPMRLSSQRHRFTPSCASDTASDSDTASPAAADDDGGGNGGGSGGGGGGGSGGGGSLDPVAVTRQRLVQLELNIERRYLKPPLGTSKGVDLSLSHLGSEENNTVPRQLNVWRDAVPRATNAAQLAMCLYMLETSIAWDKSIMKANCQFCSSGDHEEKLLLCDGCDKGYHTYCFKPAMDNIPDGDWYCYECVNKATGERACVVCGKNVGKLLLCDGCPRAYHLDCLNPPLAKAPRGKWSCVDCAQKSPKKSRPKKKTSLELSSPAAAGSENTSMSEDSAAAAPEKASPPKKDRHNKKAARELAACRGLLADLEGHEDSWPFLLPVNTKQFPSYKKIIKNPMDLSTIKKRLLDGTYKSKEDFVADLCIMFDNCVTFNEDESPVGRAGHNLRQFFQSRWNRLCSA